MNCKTFKKILAGGIKPGSEQSFLKHREECPACAHTYDKVENAMHQIRHKEVITASPYYFSKLMNRLETVHLTQPAKAPVPVLARVFIASIAAIFTAGIISITALSPRSDKLSENGSSVSGLVSEYSTGDNPDIAWEELYYEK